MSTVEEPNRPAPPPGVSEDYYQYHSYKVYPSGRRNVIEFVDTYKSFGPNQILRGLTMGLPEGMVSMILGPSGTGKSHFAEAVAHAAIEKDLRVAWFTLETLTAAIARAKADGSVARTVTRICRSDLVVVDLCRHRDYAEHECVIASFV